MDCPHLHLRHAWLQSRISDFAPIQLEPEFLGPHILEEHSSVDDRSNVSLLGKSVALWIVRLQIETSGSRKLNIIKTCEN